ncbi:hypothetical protein D4764_04G0016110 [Takifugu flavidus]|uniref:Uncharacterized protein n=1 Tax=Takifugu flavidus TaxID=433684 RepID=A0A5C6N644_9TELE|nr:hypothetical protein D4764_04G0016110 [Takifugu flavidus]
MPGLERKLKRDKQYCMDYINFMQDSSHVVMQKRSQKKNSTIIQPGIFPTMGFRKGPVAVVCDVERMFHQFHVRPEDQDYLRFLWWENGDLESPPSVFRMRVHLFGAASSPGCANFGLKHIALEEAIQLVEEARKLCSVGKLRLHKFISNSDKVLKSIPKEECAESVKNLDMALESH